MGNIINRGLPSDSIFSLERIKKLDQRTKIICLVAAVMITAAVAALLILSPHFAASVGAALDDVNQFNQILLPITLLALAIQLQRGKSAETLDQTTQCLEQVEMAHKTSLRTV